FCLQMMRIALELAKENEVYESLAIKFFQHYTYVAAAMKSMGGRGYQLWDDRDGFFYDVLRYANGEFHKFRVRSLVGLIPLFAIEVLNRIDLEPHPRFLADLEWFMRNRPDLVGHACYSVGKNRDQRYILSVVDPTQFQRVFKRLSDPNEFLSDAGIRSLSKYHEHH